MGEIVDLNHFKKVKQFKEKYEKGEKISIGVEYNKSAVSLEQIQQINRIISLMKEIKRLDEERKNDR